MKRIIVCPDGTRYEFDYSDLIGFCDYLYVILGGEPKRVEVYLDDKLNDVYRVAYL